MSDEPELNFAPPTPREVQLVLPGGKPIVTYVLLGISIFIFVLQFGTEALLGLDLPAALGMKVTNMIAAGQVWRLITPIFLHGSFLHIAVNMYSLMALGPTLENSYGRWRYLALYLLCGFAGNVFSFLFSPANSLGASTAIFGLIAAEGVFVYQNRRVFGSRAKRILTNIALITAMNFFLGMSPGIDNWGHLGGFLAGLGFAWFAGPFMEVDHQQIEGDRALIILADRRNGPVIWLAWIFVTLVFIALAVWKINTLAI